jgi:hypothetical protein
LRPLKVEVARREGENRRLEAQIPSSAEIARLQENREAVTKLAREFKELRASDEAQRTPLPSPAGRRMRDEALAAESWRNAGRSTPEAVLETTLWAAAGGDVETLTGCLWLDPSARERAEALFAGLPEQARREFGTPERLLASMTVADILLGNARILGEYPEADGTELVVRLENVSGRSRNVLLTLRRHGSDWSLAMPGAIVERYAAKLRRPAG